MLTLSCHKLSWTARLRRSKSPKMPVVVSYSTTAPFSKPIGSMTEEVDTMTSSNLQNKYPPVLCVRQVAEILVVSHNTAYELVRSGAIHSVRVGRNYRIPLESVIDYLRKH